MMINFDEMPNDSRIWIYQSNRKFSQSEENEISIKIQTFLKDWTAHGSNLFSSYCIRYNRFIVIALNETKNKSINQMWTCELTDLLESYNEFIKENHNENKETDKKLTKKLKVKK